MTSTRLRIVRTMSSSMRYTELLQNRDNDNFGRPASDVMESKIYLGRAKLKFGLHFEVLVFLRKTKTSKTRIAPRPILVHKIPE
jgi:hypothetical protein